MASIPPSFPRVLPAVAAVLLACAGCGQQVSVENADVPAWRATALPATAGTVAEDAGKLLNAQPADRTVDVPAGTYRLTLVCEGGGKAFLAVSAGGQQLLDLGAACYGTQETAMLTVADSGPVGFSASSVDAPLIYAYRLVPEG